MMKFHWGIVCTLGIAACSTNKPAEEPYTYSSNAQVTEPVAVTETPASTPADDADHFGAHSHPPVPSDSSLVGADGRATHPNHDVQPTAAPRTEPTSTEAQRLEAQRLEAQRAEAQRADAKRASAPPAGSRPSDASNTASNNQDSSKWTAADQGQGAGDVKITQQIRQAIMGDGSLSFTAKNVQVITRDGKVVLRGQVKNSQERSTIDGIARKVAAPGQVDNFLEIKP